MTLTSPVHPKGERLTPYLDNLQGPLESALAHAEGLNATLQGNLARLERSLDVALLIVTFLLLAAALLARSRWAVLLAVPAALFPLIVVADTARTLFGVLVSLAPAEDVLGASAACLPFGRVEVGSLALEMRPGLGFVVATTASVAVLASLWLHFKAHRFVR